MSGTSDSTLVYRQIDGDVDSKSTGQLTPATQPRKFRATNRFAEDYHQQYLAKNPAGGNEKEFN